MIRLATAAFVALFTLTSAASAVDLSGVRCEDPEIVTIMENGIRSARIEGGSSLMSYGVYGGGISKSVTTHASRNKLICTITIRMTESGGSGSERFRYTFQQFSGGKLTATVTGF